MVPFKLCKRCHERERARSQSRRPAPARLPPVQPAAREEESDEEEEEEVDEETRVRELEAEDGDVCLLPGCTKPKFLDLSPDVPVLHDFCCREHALQFMKSPTPAPTIVGEGFK